MKKKRKSRIIGLFFVALVLYVVVFPRGTGSELQVSIEWITAIDDAANGSDAATEASAGEREELIPFEIGDRFGFFTAAGRVSLSNFVLYGVSMGDDRFANFSAVPETVVIQDGNGRFLSSIPAAGYPLLFGRRNLLFHPDGATISEWDGTGVRLWEKEFQSVITAIHAAGDVTAVGRIDGRLTVVDDTGNELLEFRSEAGRLPVVVAVAVSPDADRVAALLDIDPQRLVVFHREEHGFEAATEHRLESQLRRPGAIHFSDDGHILFWEQPRSVESIGTGIRSSVPLTGRLSAMAVVSDMDLMATLSRSADESSDQLVFSQLRGRRVLLQLDVPGSRGFMRTSGRTLYLAVENRIIAYRLEGG